MSLKKMILLSIILPNLSETPLLSDPEVYKPPCG
jgi:hypothetical protein